MTPQKIKNFLVVALLLLILPGLGFAIGRSFTYLKREGYGKSWKKLDSQTKFVEIVEANTKNVWAQTSDGKLYYFTFRCFGESGCNQWIETQAIPPTGIHHGAESPIERGNPCPYASGFKYLENPPGNIVDCVRAFSLGMDIVPGWIVYYALVDDGTIWVWSYSDSMLDSPFYSFSGLCFGIFLGIAVIIILFRFRKKRRSIGNNNRNKESNAYLRLAGYR